MSTYRKVVSSRPGYYSILDPFGQRSQYINIKFPLQNRLKVLGCATNQDVLLLTTLLYSVIKLDQFWTKLALEVAINGCTAVACHDRKVSKLVWQSNCMIRKVCKSLPFYQFWNLNWIKPNVLANYKIIANETVLMILWICIYYSSFLINGSVCDSEQR